ncbi:MAG: hypothetical protein ABIG89_01400 [Candidatus Woesearchaeota archaeon]
MTDNEGSRMRAMSLAVITGTKIQEDYPDIADLYRGGSTIAEIVLAKGIAEEYGLSTNVALNAVGYALRGCYAGPIRYNGLIENPEERAEIARKHIENGWTEQERRKHGLRLVRENKGLFSRSVDDLVEVGKKTHKNEKGIHSSDFGSEGKRKAAIKSNEAIGNIVWSIPEYESLKRKYDSPAYKKGRGSDIERIIKELNDEYHNGTKVRDRRAVIHKLSEYNRERGTTKQYVRWTDKETAEMLSLRSEPKYQKNGGLLKVAEILNDKYHGGKEIRTSDILSRKLGYIRRQ